MTELRKSPQQRRAEHARRQAQLDADLAARAKPIAERAQELADYARGSEYGPAAARLAHRICGRCASPRPPSLGRQRGFVDALDELERLLDAADWRPLDALDELDAEGESTTGSTAAT